MKKVEIGIYRAYNNYFAFGILGKNNEKINEIKEHLKQIVKTENRNY